ncbi:MAG: rod shape-determining protein MreC [Acidobacteriota bacterium]|nr:rod shape-determining protein MreC [Acidobacteriota bacterium]
MPRKGAPTSQSVLFRRSEAGGGLRACVVLVALSLVMFTMSVREGDTGGPLNAVRGAWMTVTTPVRWVGGAITAPFQGLGNVVANLTADQGRLSDLKRENERLVARNAELEESEQTARRLESLLGLQSLYNLQSTAARIISGPTDSWSSTVTIDKGTSSGFSVGMPVTDANGAIGQIVQCGATSSTVRLISDENSSVSAMVQSTRAQGILKGSVDGTLHLTLVRTDQTVEEGDMVVTSGLGGVFPKGLPLGKVLSVERTSGSLYYEIEVEPLSSAESFEEVLVITSLTEDQKATSEDVAEADKQDTAAGGTAPTGDATTEDDTVAAEGVADGTAAGDGDGAASGSDEAGAGGDGGE